MPYIPIPETVCRPRHVEKIEKTFNIGEFVSDVVILRCANQFVIFHDALKYNRGRKLPFVLWIVVLYENRSGNAQNQSDSGNDPVICDVRVPIDLKVFPKQVSYKRSDGQMESLPLEYMNPMLEEDEFLENMLIPLYEKK